MVLFFNTYFKLKDVIFMSIFSKNSKKKLVLALACASVLNSKTSLAAQNTGKVGGAVVSSKKMGKLTKGLIIGSSILGGAGLIYEILGDTVIDKAPTLFKLIRGKSSDKPAKQDDEKPEYSKEHLKFLSEENENLSDLKKPEVSEQYKEQYRRNKQKLEEIGEYMMDLFIDESDYKNNIPEFEKLKKEFCEKHPGLDFDKVQNTIKVAYSATYSEILDNKETKKGKKEKIDKALKEWFDLVPEKYFEGINKEDFIFRRRNYTPSLGDRVELIFKGIRCSW